MLDQILDCEIKDIKVSAVKLLSDFAILLYVFTLSTWVMGY